MKVKTFDKFLSVPSTILLGSILISFSILISGGVITIKGLKTTKVNQPTSAEVAPSPAAQQPPQQPAVTIDQVKDAFNKSFLKFNNVSKKLIVLEAADPSCPYCHVAAGKNSDLNKQMGSRFILVADGGTYIAPVPEIRKLVESGKAAFAYIYTPGHGSGEMGTKALYCAFENNKFWDVHDLLMTSKGYDLLNDNVKNDKAKSGEIANFLQPAIDSSVMKQCLDSGKYDSRLKDDMAIATSMSINGTPGFYLNTTMYSGAYSFKEMEATVNSSLE